MRFGQFIENNKRNIFLQKSYRKWGSKASSKPLLVSWKSFVCSLVSKYIDSPQLGIQQKQTVEVFRLLIQRYFQFWFFLKKDLGIVSPQHLCIIFQEKCYLCYILLTEQLSCLIPLASWDIGQYLCCN